MFWFVVDVLMLRRLGLGRPFRYVILAVLFACVVAAVVYTTVFFKAIEERSHASHVHSYHSN